jgi:predicted nucleic acid-binding protein
LSKTPIYYWDSCAWLGLLNKEAAKHRELEIIWKAAERGDCLIYTSALSQVEVFKRKCEAGDAKPLSEENDALISEMFKQPHVLRVQLEPIMAEHARSLLRKHPNLKKANDAIHLATALFTNCDAMHTYDNVNLLGLSNLVLKRDGTALEICLPDATVDGPLFSAMKDIHEK